MTSVGAYIYIYSKERRWVTDGDGKSHLGRSPRPPTARDGIAGVIYSGAIRRSIGHCRVWSRGATDDCTGFRCTDDLLAARINVSSADRAGDVISGYSADASDIGGRCVQTRRDHADRVNDRIGEVSAVMMYKPVRETASFWNIASDGRPPISHHSSRDYIVIVVTR